MQTMCGIGYRIVMGGYTRFGAEDATVCYVLCVVSESLSISNVSECARVYMPVVEALPLRVCPSEVVREHRSLLRHSYSSF